MFLDLILNSTKDFFFLKSLQRSAVAIMWLYSTSLYKQYNPKKSTAAAWIFEKEEFHMMQKLIWNKSSSWRGQVFLQGIKRLINGKIVENWTNTYCLSKQYFVYQNSIFLNIHWERPFTCLCMHAYGLHSRKVLENIRLKDEVTSKWEKHKNNKLKFWKFNFLLPHSTW